MPGISRFCGRGDSDFLQKTVTITELKLRKDTVGQCNTGLQRQAYGTITLHTRFIEVTNVKIDIDLPRKVEYLGKDFQNPSLRKAFILCTKKHHFISYPFCLAGFLLGIFSEGGKIYCYANFFCYAIVFGPNFRERQKFSGGANCLRGAPPCPLWKKASLCCPPVYFTPLS